MIIRRSSSGTALRWLKPKNGGHALSSSGPELKKSISMKMRYKMSLNKHRVPFFRVYIVSRAFQPSSSSFFLRAFPSFFVVTVHHDTLVRARAQLRKILKLFYLKFYNSHGETERVGVVLPTPRVAHR